jgi:hypothetical protein
LRTSIGLTISITLIMVSDLTNLEASITSTMGSSKGMYSMCNIPVTGIIYMFG